MGGKGERGEYRRLGMEVRDRGKHEKEGEGGKGNVRDIEDWGGRDE